MAATASFQVADIREVFASDLSNFIADTREKLARFVSDEGSLEDITEPARNAHSMKGVAAMVGAWGLSWLGEDFEKLYEVVQSFFNSERERANEIARFIANAAQRWELMAKHTLNEEFGPALDIYRSIRADAAKWEGYLPARAEAAAEPVRMKPVTAAAGLARKASKPAIQVAGEEPENGAENDVEKAAPFKPGKGVAGVARRASAPAMQVADAQPENADGAAKDAGKVKPSASAAGMARGASKPAMRVAGPAETTEPEIQVKPSGEAAGVARAIPVPALKVAAEKMQKAAVSSEFEEIFRQEAAGYFDELSVVLGRLRVADSDEGWETARRLCHTLKGSAAQVGLDAISEQAKTAEYIARCAEEEKESRGTARVADIIRAVEQTAKLLGRAFKLAAVQETPAPAPKAAQSVDKELVAAFVLDAQEQIGQIEIALLSWERGEAVDASRNAAMRGYHTLKGAANSIGMTEIGGNIHAVESLVEKVAADGGAPQKEFFTFLLSTVDQLRKHSGILERDPSATWTVDWRPTVAALSQDRVEAQQPVAAAPQPAEAPQQSQPDFDAELVRAVALDIRDQAGVLEAAVIAWEREQDSASQVQAAYRACHTLKGSANSVGMKELGADFHAAETLLDRARIAGSPKPSANLVAFLLRAADQLAHHAEDLQRDPLAPWTSSWKKDLAAFDSEFRIAGAKGAQQAAAAADDDTAPVQVDTLRVDVARIHKLMNQVGELVVERNRFHSKIERAVQLRQLLGNNRQRLTRIVENFQDQFEYSSARRGQGGGSQGRTIVPFTTSQGGSTDEFSELEFDRYDEFNMLSRQLTEVADDLGQVTGELERLIESFRTDEQRFASNSKVMQEDITTLTSQPVHMLFRRLDRIFRDALGAEEKRAQLRFEGANTTLDRSIIERLYTPLLHLVRNAVAHGIESPEDRTAAGKSDEGLVVVGAAQSSNQIVITIRDDGRGIDPTRVLARAKERGLVGADVAEFSNDETLKMIFSPGFSTATDVTSIAGRGVGLDVVKAEIEAMNGSVTAEWQPGAGTTWKLSLPLSLAVTEAIIVGLGSDEFAIPLNFTESGLLINPGQVRMRDGREHYAIGDEELPLISLASVFGYGDEEGGTRGVILSMGDQRAVLVVDRVPARREIVVKGFDPLLARHPLLEGATLNAEGHPVLILNAAAMLRHFQSGIVARPAPRVLEAADSKKARERGNDERFTALVVDDSLSVRTVQERLLGDLGCEVILATDGLDALEKMREHRVDIVFTDLEMPRMNGYDLISTIRLNAAWASLPVVLVTSRAGQKHLDKAVALGCNDFLVKPFTQDDLARVLNQQGDYKLASVA